MGLKNMRVLSIILLLMCPYQVSHSIGILDNVRFPYESKIDVTIAGVASDSILVEFQEGFSHLISSNCRTKECDFVGKVKENEKATLIVRFIDLDYKLLVIQGCDEADCTDNVEVNISKVNARKIAYASYFQTRTKCLLELDETVAKRLRMTVIKARWLRRSGEYDPDFGAQNPEFAEMLHECTSSEY